jgi:hypothetical protein
VSSLEIALTALASVLGGGGAIAGIVAWRGRAQLLRIKADAAREQRVDEAAAAASEREDTASRAALDVLRDRLRIVEEREAQREYACEKRMDAVQARLSGCEADKREMHESIASLRAENSALDTRLSIMEQRSSR